jgi:hypothetical protein
MDICRICYEESTKNNPLVNKCDCKGSIGFLHKSCLREWVRVSLKYQCELCQTMYITEELQLENLYEPPPHLLHICIYPHLLFLNLVSFYFAYLLYNPNESFYGLLGFSLWKKDVFYQTIGSVFESIPYNLILTAGVQGVILGPAIGRLNNKYRYLRYCCAWERINGMQLNVYMFYVFLLIGFMMSFYYSIASSLMVLIFLSKTYYVHSQLILKINMDIMRDTIFGMLHEN